MYTLEEITDLNPSVDALEGLMATLDAYDVHYTRLDCLSIDVHGYGVVVLDFDDPIFPVWRLGGRVKVEVEDIVFGRRVGGWVSEVETVEIDDDQTMMLLDLMAF